MSLKSDWQKMRYPMMKSWEEQKREHADEKMRKISAETKAESAYWIILQIIVSAVILISCIIGLVVILVQ